MNDKYELDLKIRESKGMDIVNKMREHSFSYNILSMNYHEIKEGFRLFENPEVALRLWAVDNREEGDQAFREINRLFHNYLAGAQTLIEHTRIFMRSNYNGTALFIQYNERIQNEFFDDSLCKFIQDLRNFMLHKGLPHSNMTFTGGTDEDFLSTVYLDVERLKSWSKWTAPSKKFLFNCKDENLSIHELIESYWKKISELYEWLNLRIEEWHRDDLNELKMLQGVYIKKYGV